MIDLKESWKGLKPAPIEFLHGKLMDLFHEYRRSINKDDTYCYISGIELSNIIGMCKTLTYAEYPGQNKAIKIEEPTDRERDEALLKEFMEHYRRNTFHSPDDFEDSADPKSYYRLPEQEIQHN